jgi:uncharacterized membrane protein (DUF2068 family)
VDGSSLRGDRVVVLIGSFKLLKAVLLGGLAAIWFSGAVGAGSVFDTAAWLGALDGHRAVQRAVARLASLDERALRDLAIAALVYGAVFMTEGIGLLMRRRWAEWLTVFVTGSFVPFEAYELVHRPGPGKLVTLVINVAIVIYLAWRRITARAEHRAESRPRFRAA